MFNHQRPTAKSEREFAEWSRETIYRYWRTRGFDIKVWVEPPVVLKDGVKHHRAPIFAVRSNIGPYGYPPRQVAA